MSPPIVLPEAKGVKHVLVIDPSASHLAYAILDLNYVDSTYGILKCGMMWVPDKWLRGRRFSYMGQAIKFLLQTHTPPIMAVYSEQFFSNPKLMFGSAVIPTINGLIEMTCYDVSPDRPIPFNEIPPPSWRAILGIKPNKNAAGKRDYKVPTKAAVEAKLGKLPEKIVSNITGKDRDLPNDVSDVLAIAMSIGESAGLKCTGMWGNTFYYKQLLDKLKEINNE